ncbi:Uncharacterised protein [Anaerotruncus sp. 2789STDY5834896]|uniref:Uncharacterized protein n=1 Tax=uncultured Anaerotruncus sp. TaxID=905011 RepID=A0A1C6K6L5_9FIRM|nr:Uncharacterised protein [uncultured Anaerotruncus sp.]
MICSQKSYEMVTRPGNVVYGIRCTTGQESPLFFADPTSAERVVELFNRCQLSPNQFLDALRDAVYENFCSR